MSRKVLLHFPWNAGNQSAAGFADLEFLAWFSLGMGSQVTQAAPSESGHLCVTRVWLSPWERQEIIMGKEKGRKGKIKYPKALL